MVFGFKLGWDGGSGRNYQIFSLGWLFLMG